MAPWSWVATGHQCSPVGASQGAEAQTQRGRQAGGGQAHIAMGGVRFYLQTDSLPASFLFSAPWKPHFSLHLCLSLSFPGSLSHTLSFPSLLSLPHTHTPSPPHTLSFTHTDTHLRWQPVVVPWDSSPVLQWWSRSRREPVGSTAHRSAALPCEPAAPLASCGRAGCSRLGHTHRTSHALRAAPGPSSLLAAAPKPGRSRDPAQVTWESKELIL